jgi:hypothetical protein
MKIPLPPDVPKQTLSLLNKQYEIEQKILKNGDPCNLSRNVNKMKDIFEEIGLYYEDPMGQSFKETRTDLEATISGQGTENLTVVQVIKPIIRVSRLMNSQEIGGARTLSRVAQKGIVIVESQIEPK